jgi:hypothetical protein
MERWTQFIILQNKLSKFPGIIFSDIMGTFKTVNRSRFKCSSSISLKIAYRYTFEEI